MLHAWSACGIWVYRMFFVLLTCYIINNVYNTPCNGEHIVVHYFWYYLVPFRQNTWKDIQLSTLCPDSCVFMFRVDLSCHDCLGSEFSYPVSFTFAPSCEVFCFCLVFILDLFPTVRFVLYLIKFVFFCIPPLVPALGFFSRHPWQLYNS